MMDGAYRVKNDFIYELKEFEEGYFHLLLLCTLFTNGILTSDIELLCKILGQSQWTWLVFITVLSLASSVAEIDDIDPYEEDVEMLEKGMSLSEVLKNNFIKDKKLHKMWIELK